MGDSHLPDSHLSTPLEVKTGEKRIALSESWRWFERGIAVYSLYTHAAFVPVNRLGRFLYWFRNPDKLFEQGKRTVHVHHDNESLPNFETPLCLLPKWSDILAKICQLTIPAKVVARLWRSCKALKKCKQEWASCSNNEEMHPCAGKAKQIFCRRAEQKDNWVFIHLAWEYCRTGDFTAYMG